VVFCIPTRQVLPAFASQTTNGTVPGHRGGSTPVGTPSSGNNCRRFCPKPDTAGEFKRARPETALACAISPAPGSDTPESDSNVRVTLRCWPYEMNSPAVSNLRKNPALLSINLSRKWRCYRSQSIMFVSADINYPHYCRFCLWKSRPATARDTQIHWRAGVCGRSASGDCAMTSGRSA